jgi:hypothetical protein
MSQALAPSITQERLSLADGRLYLACVAMILGNLALPYAFHQIPAGGRMFMPILFFTLVAGWRFGLNAALLTAVASPLASHFLTGMPGTAMLTPILLQSALLGVLAALAGRLNRTTSFALLALVVLANQALNLLPTLILNGAPTILPALRAHYPAMALQLFAGFAVLKGLERFLPLGNGREA